MDNHRYARHLVSGSVGHWNSNITNKSIRERSSVLWIIYVVARSLVRLRSKYAFEMVAIRNKSISSGKTPGLMCKSDSAHWESRYCAG